MEKVEENEDSGVEDPDRRSFMKKIGMGAGFAGLAMMPGASALEIGENQVSGTDQDFFDVTDDLDLNDNDILNVGSIDGFDSDDFVSFETGVTLWEDGLDGVEIHRRELDSGESLVLNRLEFLEQGGGSVDSDASVDLIDVDNNTTVRSVDLNNFSSNTVSVDGSTAVVELTQETGSDVFASVTAEWRVIQD